MRLNDARLSAYEASIVVFMGIFRWNYRIHTGGIIEFPWGGTDVRKCRLFIGPSWPGGVKGAGLSAPRDQSEVRRALHRQYDWLKRRPRCTGAAMRSEVERTRAVSADRWPMNHGFKLWGQFSRVFHRKIWPQYSTFATRSTLGICHNAFIFTEIVP